MPTEQKPDFPFEAARMKKESAGWERKGFRKANPARGIPFGGGGSGKPMGGRQELAQLKAIQEGKPYSGDPNEVTETQTFPPQGPEAYNLPDEEVAAEYMLRKLLKEKGLDDGEIERRVWETMHAGVSEEGSDTEVEGQTDDGGDGVVSGEGEPAESVHRETSDGPNKPRVRR